MIKSIAGGPCLGCVDIRFWRAWWVDRVDRALCAKTDAEMHLSLHLCVVTNFLRSCVVDCVGALLLPSLYCDERWEINTTHMSWYFAPAIVGTHAPLLSSELIFWKQFSLLSVFRLVQHPSEAGDAPLQKTETRNTKRKKHKYQSFAVVLNPLGPGKKIISSG